MLCHLNILTTYKVLSKYLVDQTATHTNTHTSMYYDTVINQIMSEHFTLHHVAL